MSWYKSGTVSVAQNSNAVIGTGTAFILNGRVGDAFVGPDGEMYEVANIASDTALAISTPYKGPTIAVGHFALIPIQGYVKDTADALRQASNQIADSIDGLEESVQEAADSAAAATASKNAAATSESNASQSSEAALASKNAASTSATNAGNSASAALALKNAAGTSATNASDSAAAALASKNAAAISEQNTANKAAKGANSDITSITGLTTALAVNQGGTGGNTQALARAGLGLKSASTADTIGTVSQAAGVPTGALMEYGTNANGEFWKYACGMMVCTRLVDINSTITTGLNGGFYNPGLNNLGVPSQDMPATFSTLPKINITITCDDAAGTTAWIGGASVQTVSKWPRCYQMELFSRTTVQVYRISYTAIGRWF
ncbi:hypothetical protein ACQR3P_01725 [Rhodococcus sp. IEGM1300]